MKDRKPPIFEIDRMELIGTLRIVTRGGSCFDFVSPPEVKKPAVAPQDSLPVD